MYLEQEIASIIKFVLDNSGNPAPYYYNVPQSFQVPAAYFPTPEITTNGETFRTYRMEFSWHINFFHKTTEQAYEVATKAFSAILKKRNLIPLIDTDGVETGEGVRVNDPSFKPVDDGCVQLSISFVSRRPYDYTEPQKMQQYAWENSELYGSTTINAAMEEALSQYLTDES